MWLSDIRHRWRGVRASPRCTAWGHQIPAWLYRRHLVFLSIRTKVKIGTLELMPQLLHTTLLMRQTAFPFLITVAAAFFLPLFVRKCPEKSSCLDRGF